LQRHVADSEDVCRLLRIRMEELIVFLEDMLSATPAKGDGKARRELMSSCLNQTRELLADLAVRHHDYGTVTIQDFRAQLLT